MSAQPQRLVAALDLGSTKIVAVIAEVTGDARESGARILGLGVERSPQDTPPRPCSGESPHRRAAFHGCTDENDKNSTGEDEGHGERDEKATHRAILVRPHTHA